MSEVTRTKATITVAGGKIVERVIAGLDQGQPVAILVGAKKYAISSIQKDRASSFVTTRLADGREFAFDAANLVGAFIGKS